MKKRAMKKDFYMEIKKSLNRFISIFFIVAMGVAFYSGIQSAAPDMRYTGDAYFDENKLMDLKVIGTLGLTADDIDALSKVEGIETVEPGYMADVLSGTGTSQKVLHIESILPALNQLNLTEGRLPQRPDECFMDTEYAAAQGYEVGDTVAIQESLKDGGNPVLNASEFKITGIGSSPVYISFGRGNTTLGTGEIAGFLYVPEESFRMDVYTQAYIIASGAEEAVAYSEQYGHIVEEVQKKVEGIEEIRCEARLQEVQEEAGQKLNDAKLELEDGRTEAEEKLADAKKTIRDGEKRLKEGKQELADARTKLEEGKEELASQEAELEKARTQTADGQVKLDAAKKELTAKEAEYKAKTASAQKAIEDGEKALKDGKAKLEQGKKEYRTGKAKYENGKKEYDANRADYNKQKSAYGTGLAGYQEGENQYAAGLASYTQQKSQYDAAIAAGISADSPEMQLSKQQLDGAKQQLDSTRATLDQTKIRLEEAGKQLDAALPQLNAAETELKKTEKRLSQAKKELEASEKMIQEKEAELDKGKKELEDGKNALASGKAKLAEQEANLHAALNQIADGAEKIREAKQKLEEARQEIADADTEISEKELELEDGKQEYKDARKEAKEKIADGEAKIADGEKELADLKKPEWMVDDRNSLIEYTGYGDNADRLNSIGEVFPVIFFLVAALISLTTMTRMVEEQRIQIGTLKALGYGKLSIASKYVNYALLATIGGSIFGVLVGEKLLPFVIIRAYGIMYHHMPNLEIPYNLKHGLTATGTALFCTMAATISACYKELSATPAALMRPPAPKQGKRVFIERITFLWKHFNFSWKSTIRNLFRYKKRFFMTIFGIGGCMALLIVGFGLQDSIMNIAALQYGEIQNYDSMVILDEKVTGEQLAEVEVFLDEADQVRQTQEIYMKKVQANGEKKSIDLYLMATSNPDTFPSFVHLHDRITKEEYKLDDEGILLTEKTADLLGVSVGDSIRISEKDNGFPEVKVAAVCENYMGHYAYMTAGLYQKIYGGPPKNNTILIQMNEGTGAADTEQVGEQVLSFEGTLSVSYTGSIQEQLDNMLGSLDTVIVVLIISAGMLAIVVLYNLNNININERKRELATLKVLGFYDMEVGNYVYRENILLTLVGAVLGIGLGIFLHRFVIVTAEVDACMFGRNIDFSSFVISMLFTFTFSVIVNFVMFYKLRKIDMVESLKSIE